MSSTRTGARTTWVAVRVLLLFTLLLGVAYPLVITAIGQLALPAQANGSLVARDGETVGSQLIGQSFSDSDGAPLPEWFQPRPSAAGDGYDAGASSGSNWGPEHPDLIAAITERRAGVAEHNGTPASEVPVDALTASASGLDPHISPAYALLQVERVAAARHLPVETVRELVESTVQKRDLGYLGEPTVNVLMLNLALAQLGG
ncbi:MULTISPECIES: potassium-transporting ATPase subunit KdpC [unclassified Leucobacter]|uniref:potassium-transporting ATPase subunit KdpC n=1 Tax=unclassified Leucobacter TaxID=2621730 RepID=UPI00165D7E34|nr:MULTISPECIES: potassium-transporting ATPase subunit KdpC [unclassified Leucobacter]MBC9926183.1 potassium-transporting ATPase subunit KdpC [Leucobacter sp. cx-169]MBC9935858.1 potassium-transporting ATPase subunit KdpC [Leucobacter sp. cx-87]